MRKTRKCAFCGKELTCNSGSQKYCSEHCAETAKAQQKKKRQDFIKAVEPVIDNKQHLILTQKKDLSINKNDEKLDNEIEQAAFGREQQKIIQVQCNKEIAGLVEKLKKLTDGVVNAQDTLTSASISFLSHLNGFTFMRSE